MNQIFPLALSYDDVLLIPQYSEIPSRSLVDLTTYISPRISLKLPFISTNMSDVTGLEMAIKMGKLGGAGIISRFYSVDEQSDIVSKVKNENLICIATVGVKEGNIERADSLVNAGADLLLIDVAHGHMKSVIDTTKQLKNRFKDKVGIIAGNIATYEAACDLFKAGADCVRVGIGPGSICTTRIMTGSGMPQLTAVMQASKAARKFKRTVIADGGCKNSGDFAKALAAGASAICAGNIFAGTDEAPGSLVEIDGIKYKVYNGSTSLAEKKNHTKKDNKLDENYIKYVEGVESYVKYKGQVENIVNQLEHGVRSAFTYSGAKTIEEFWKKAKFVQVTSVGIRENGSHDVLLKDIVNIDKIKVKTN